MNVSAIDFLGTLIYIGSMSYADSATGDQADGFLLGIGSVVSRWGSNGASMQFTGFDLRGLPWKFGTVFLRVDDLTAHHQPADVVQV